MSLWTSDYRTGETICAICGLPKGNRTRCCRTAPRVDFDTFCRSMFAGEPVDATNIRIFREFYSDYRHSDSPSLKAYVESR